MKKSLQLSMDLYYIGMILYIYGMKPCMILYIYGMKPYHICIKSYGVIVSHTDNYFPDAGTLRTHGFISPWEESVLAVDLDNNTDNDIM